jgi:hypothetical protein
VWPHLVAAELHLFWMPPLTCGLTLTQFVCCFAAAHCASWWLHSCIQEEQKVALLSQHLAATGVDVEALLATIKTEEEPEGEA